MIQMLGRYYVPYFNYTYRSSGTLWRGRYKASPIDSGPFALTCYRYIELNPARANRVTHPAEYLLSSHRSNALGENDGLLKPRPLFLNLVGSADARQAAYLALFEVALNEKTLEEVRSSLNKAWVLGSEQFKSRNAAELNRRACPLPKGCSRKSAQREGA